MKKITFVFIFTFFFVSNHALSAIAGVEPSPFRYVDRIDAISMHVEVMEKRFDERLSYLPNGEISREIKSAVVELHEIAFSINGLNGLFETCMTKILISVNPQATGAGSIASGLALRLPVAKKAVKSLLKRIDAFLETIPDEAEYGSEFHGATLNLRSEVKTMLKNIKRAMKDLKALSLCNDDTDCGCNGDMVPCDEIP